MDGKLAVARSILQQGLQQCPENEDMWLEYARIANPEQARPILAKAVKTLPKSVKIWLTAAKKETDKQLKSKVLRRALENIPNSERLWRELIELEGEGEAKILLYHAVECIPHDLEMWLALAKLETYENARAVLNKARQALPHEYSIWVHAAKLEESEGRPIKNIENIIARGMQVLAKNAVKIKREDWLNEAILAEKSSNPLTSAAIIKLTIANVIEGLDQDDK